MNLVDKIIPESASHPPIDTSVPPTLILHTNGASHAAASLYTFIVNSKTRIYPHGQVAFDGTVEQYCPWDRQAFVQYDGNRYARSLETEDSGYNVKPIDRDPWTDAQLHAIADVAVLLGIPARACTSPTSGGVGFHSQFRNEWNRDGHNCPGSGRRDQIPQILAYMTQVVVAQDPTSPPSLEEAVPYLMIAVTGYSNVFAAFPSGVVRQMVLAEYAWLKAQGVPMITDSTVDGAGRLIVQAGGTAQDLVAV